VLQRPRTKRFAGHVHDWRSVSRPPEQAGIGMLTVLTIDPANPQPGNAASVLGAGNLLYANARHLFVTSGSIEEIVARRSGRVAYVQRTRIHEFDISDSKKTTYIGSGEVPGHLLNQFSMSEHDGYLRAATTLEAVSQGTSSQSVVTVLARRAGKLVAVGKIGNLGSGERIYSVRFIGAKAYVVTFRQVDPLHVIDLSSPAQPKLVGELKLAGYSAYLHPISDTLLLGVGRDADEQGGAKGLLFSLFDVSQPADPKLLHKRVIGNYASSSVEWNHLAFLYWKARDLVVVPASIRDDESQTDFNGAVAMKVTEAAGFGKESRVTHAGRRGANDADYSVARSLVVGDRLFTVSSAGVLVSDLDSFGDVVWIRL
jgi:uncharacterized secreted protein with C-terminal beta-propeller domain